MKNEAVLSPLVTVVTPSFNQGEFIRFTIESVLSQDYDNIEYIVIDGGSTDNTIEILKSYGDRIKWISEKDKGQSNAVNKGFKMAKGQIIGWLNSDDIYESNAVSTVVNFFSQNEDIGFIYGEAFYIDINGKIIEKYPTEDFNYERLARTCFVCQPAVFLKQEVIRKCGLLDENLHYCMDYEYWMKISRYFTCTHIANILARSRLYSYNKTLSKTKEVHEEVVVTVYKNYGYVPNEWICGLVKYSYPLKSCYFQYIMVICYMIKFNFRSFDLVREFYRLLKRKLKC